MQRKFGTTSLGSSFDDARVEAVWSKGKVVPGKDPRFVRQDACGAWIRREDYGQTTNSGWEIDHIQPVAKDGSDNLSNLQPLQWENNRHKSDNWPRWTCKLQAV